MRRINSKIRELTGDWPRSVAGTLFIDDPELGVHYLDKKGVAKLFGWLRSQFNVSWKGGATRPKQEEVFAELERTATRYNGIELLPHEPAMEGIYYRGATPPPGDGKHLDRLLDRFNPATLAGVRT